MKSMVYLKENASTSNKVQNTPWPLCADEMVYERTKENITNGARGYNRTTRMRQERQRSASTNAEN